MVRLMAPVWNLYCTTPMIEIGVPCPMPTKVIGFGRGVMGPKKSIFTDIWKDLHWYQRWWEVYFFEAGRYHQRQDIG